MLQFFSFLCFKHKSSSFQALKAKLEKTKKKFNPFFLCYYFVFSLSELLVNAKSMIVSVTSSQLKNGRKI